MDPASIALVISLIGEGIGVAKEIHQLVKRVQAGEKITEEDIKQARQEIDDAVLNWGGGI